MTILVFGKTGQVAQALQHLRAEAVFLGREAADLSQPQQVVEAIKSHAPTGVINAAAFTGVDAAEEARDLAQRVNADAPGAMAKICAQMDIPFVHFSTDYVFDGTGSTAKKPQDPTGPINAYGRTKLAGEAAIKACNGRFVILRTSWVFSATGQNFVKTMLRLSQTHEQLNVVADQFGGPTAAADIAAASLSILEKLQAGAPSGVYHFSGAPAVSWAEFARAIFQRAGKTTLVNDIPSSAFPTPAERPKNSRMDMGTLLEDYGIHSPDWRAALDKVLEECI